MNQKGFSSILIVLGVIVILGLAGSAYYFGWQNNQYTSDSQKLTNPTIDLKTMPTAPSSTKHKEGFAGRQFNVAGNFFGYVAYPKEILDFAESELVYIKCSKLYDLNNYKDPLTELSYWDYSENNDIRLEDSTIISLLPKLNGTLANGISALKYCETEDNRFLVIYQEWLPNKTLEPPWEPGVDPHFVVISAQGEISGKTTITDSQSYSSDDCWRPLLLTNTNIAYIQCGSFQKVPSADSYIFKVDFNTKTHSLITHCNQKPKDANFSFNPLAFEYNPEDFLIQCN